MINWLIHLFSGATKEEYMLLNSEYNNQRELVNIFRARFDYIESELKEEREERKQLQSIIFKNYGVTHSAETGVISETELKPINNGSQRWSNLRSRLEQDDRERLKGFSDAKVS